MWSSTPRSTSPYPHIIVHSKLLISSLLTGSCSQCEAILVWWVLRTTELLSFLFTLFIYIYCNRGFRFFYLSIDSSLLVTTLAPLTACPLSHWWDMSPCLWFFTPKDGNFVISETHERMHEHWPLNPYDKLLVIPYTSRFYATRLFLS